MAINRAEKEALDAVCVIAAPNGALRKVTDAIDSAVANVRSIMNSGDVELPEEMVDNMNASLTALEGFKESYIEKAKLLADCNQRLSDDLARRVSGSNQSAAETSASTKSATASTSGISGGVKE